MAPIRTCVLLGLLSCARAAFKWEIFTKTSPTGGSGKCSGNQPPNTTVEGNSDTVCPTWTTQSGTTYYVAMNCANTSGVKLYMFTSISTCNSALANFSNTTAISMAASQMSGSASAQGPGMGYGSGFCACQASNATRCSASCTDNCEDQYKLTCIPPPTSSSSSPPPSSTSSPTSTTQSNTSSSSTNASVSATATSPNGACSSNCQTYTGEIAAVMTTVDANKLVANLSKAKAVFASAIESNLLLSISNMTYTITITKVYLCGTSCVEVSGRRLNSTSSGQSTVKVEWELTTEKSANTEILLRDMKLVTNRVAFQVVLQQLLTEAGFDVAVIALTVETLSGLPKAATSQCAEWNMRASFASVLIGFFALAWMEDQHL